jgi:hypothetical protein
MSLSGWIFMLVSWVAILSLFVYSMARTLGFGHRPSTPQEPPDGEDR